MSTKTTLKNIGLNQCAQILHWKIYDLQDLVKTKFWSTKQTLYPIIMALIAWLYDYAQRTF